MVDVVTSDDSVAVGSKRIVETESEELVETLALLDDSVSSVVIVVPVTLIDDSDEVLAVDDIATVEAEVSVEETVDAVSAAVVITVVVVDSTVVVVVMGSINGSSKIL